MERVVCITSVTRGNGRGCACVRERVCIISFESDRTIRDIIYMLNVDVDEKSASSSTERAGRCWYSIFCKSILDGWYSYRGYRVV